MGQMTAVRDAARASWGLALLAAFELVVVWVTFTLGATSLALASLVAATLLLAAAAAGSRHSARPLLLVGVAVATLLRAIPQTSGPLDAGDVARYAVPVGFLLAAAAARLGRWWGLGGVVAIAAARSYFVFLYLSFGATTLVVGNLLGAAGAWLWASALLPRQDVAAPEETGAGT